MVMESVGLVVMALYLAPEVSLESKELFFCCVHGTRKLYLLNVRALERKRRDN